MFNRIKAKPGSIFKSVSGKGNLATPITSLSPNLFKPTTVSASQRPTSTSTSSTRQSVNVNQSLAPNISTPQGPGQVQPDGSIIIVDAQGRPTGGAVSSGGVGSTLSPTYTPAPVTIGARQNRQGSPTAQNAAININPTITPETLGARSAAGGSSFASTGVSSPAGGSVSLPSTPGSSNYGLVNNAGVASALSGQYALDPATGQLVPVPQEKIDEERNKEPEMSSYDKFLAKVGLPPKKENVFNDPMVRAQQEEVRKQQEIVNNYTAQLNQVVAKQQADLLNLREIGSREGVTETVYGGQQAQINKEAAVKALPLQAALAGAQGNLQLAENYLSDLTKIRAEEIDNEFNYRKELRKSLIDFMTAEEQKEAAKLDKADQRAWELYKLNLTDQDAAYKAALGQPDLVQAIANLDPKSPNFRNELARLSGSATDRSPLSILDVQRYEESYPDAGVRAGDSQATADEKVRNWKIKSDIETSKNNGYDYQTVLREINRDDSIANKPEAIRIAQEIYNDSGVNNLITDITRSLFRNN